MKPTLLPLVIFIIFLASLGSSWAQTPHVMVFELREDIGPPTNRHVLLALEHARDIKADYVVIDLDTYGGAVKDADEIRSRLMEFEKPVWVFINKNAASAGALISIACDKIYMAPGANIGAATVVNGMDGEKAPDKYQSYMRSMMRATAETNGRDPKIAEAMVDESLEVEGISSAGQVITFTTKEAIQHGFCEGQASSIEKILADNGITDYQLTRYEPSSLEGIIHFFLNPAISGILILIILGGIYFELQTPGVGFPLFAAVLAAMLYFVPYYLTGLAAHWEIVLFLVGILLIAAEIFVIPGFGVAGILGILATLSALVLVMLNNDFLDFTFVSSDALIYSLTSILGASLGTIVLMFVGASHLSSGNSVLLRRVALQNTLQTDEGFTSSTLSNELIGCQGIAYTVLRPSGKIQIAGQIYDASTQGDYVERGEFVEVIGHHGSFLRVQKVTNA